MQSSSPNRINFSFTPSSPIRESNPPLESDRKVIVTQMQPIRRVTPEHQQQVIVKEQTPIRVGPMPKEKRIFVSHNQPVQVSPPKTVVMSHYQNNPLQVISSQVREQSSQFSPFRKI